MNIEKYMDLVETVKSSYASEKAKIENNDKWTPQAKAEAQRELSERFNQRLSNLKTELAAERESRLKSLETKLFAVGDNPALAMAYRDGIARATATETQEQLQDMLTQALETGDKTLAKATAYVAQKHGYFEIAQMAFDGAYQTYFQEYMSIQSALANPISKESLEESFMFASVN